MKGKTDKTPWIYALWTDNFVDIEGDLKPHPRFWARAKMLWDEEYFYIGVDLEETHVWGNTYRTGLNHYS